jgi:ribosomal protein S12
VPRTFINGEWSKHLRKYISANFSLKSILDLPSNVFGRDICTSIIVLQNVMPNEAATKLYNVDISEEKVCYEYINDLNHSLVKDGIWTTNIVLKQAINDFKVLRGNVDSSSLSTKGLYPIIHSTDINGLKNNNWKPTRFCSEPKSSAFHKLVKCGDIVLIRVGRNCGKATRIDFNKQLPVSDCLWIIRGNDMSLSNKIWNIINSKQFIEDISKLRKGVGAYYLTTEMFMQYINDKLKYASG